MTPRAIAVAMITSVIAAFALGYYQSRVEFVRVFVEMPVPCHMWSTPDSRAVCAMEQARRQRNPGE